MRKKKGFTLMEMLIVVVIIAILVAIAIPVFTTQLEKTREATDLANVRAAYAEIMVLAVTQETPPADSDVQVIGEAGNYVYKTQVSLTQKKEGWTTKTPIKIAGVEFNGTTTDQWVGTPKEGGTCVVSYSEKTGPVFNWGGLTSVAGSCWNYENGYVTYNVNGYAKYEANAITEQISATGGQKIRYSSLTDNEIINAELNKGYKYKIGLFYLDPETSNGNGGLKVLVDTTEVAMPAKADKFTISGGGIQSGQSVKVAIQIFKYNTDSNGNYSGKPIEMSNEEANAFASLFYVSDN